MTVTTRDKERERVRESLRGEREREPASESLPMNFGSAREKE